MRHLVQTCKTLVSISAAALILSGSAFASGFSIFEQGAKATGMAGAFAATADDPSAIFYNVAGIAQQRNVAFMAGGTTINFSNQFTGDPNDPWTSGSQAEYRHHTFIPPNAYLLLPFGKNITFGIGMFTPYGLRTDWQQPFIGRYVARDTNLKALSVQPSLAWQTDDGRFALGAGYEYRRTHVILAREVGAYNPFSQTIDDVASTYLSADWKSKSGYTLGLLFKPSDKWRIGASYRSKMDVGFDGTVKVTQIASGNPEFDAIVKSQLPPSQNVTTSISMPSTSIVGLATTVIPTWTVEADVTYTTWNVFKTLDINFQQTPAANIHRVENWKNTWSYRLGTNKTVNPNWDVRLGFVYDKNPQPTNAVSPLLPDADRSGLCFGVGWHKGPLSIDLADMVLHFQKRNTDGLSDDNFNGTYKTDANLIGVNLGYKF